MEEVRIKAEIPPLSVDRQRDKTMSDHHAQRVQEMIAAGKERTDDPFSNMDSLVSEMRNMVRPTGGEGGLVREKKGASVEEDMEREEASADEDIKRKGASAEERYPRWKREDSGAENIVRNYSNNFNSTEFVIY